VILFFITFRVNLMFCSCCITTSTWRAWCLRGYEVSISYLLRLHFVKVNHLIMS